MAGVQEFPFNIEYVVSLLNLRIRRNSSDGVYTDCPFCGDNRGKLKINYDKNVWRCNYCNESGGMLRLYAKFHNITTSEANREICDTILNGDNFDDRSPEMPIATKPVKERIISAPLADIPTIHKTLTALLGLLKLSEQHREHLRKVRGLSDEEIARLGYKSTPPYYMCRPLAKKLISLGCTVEGVPGFYMKNGEWMLNFSTVLSGILLPVRGVDGMIRGFQIRLDVPLKNKDDPPEKQGAKYVWHSSAGKPHGISACNPVHYIGEQCAKVVYLTEGILKADIAHYLMNRTFIAVAGINNYAGLDLMLSYLSHNGTQTIIAAPDMDRFRNENVSIGINKIGIMVKKHGMNFRMLHWNPNYKGVDDWQLAIKQKSTLKEDRTKNFKKRFIYGLCGIGDIDNDIALWHENENISCELHEFLGLTEDEIDLYAKHKDSVLEERLLSQRHTQHYRIYQLRLNDGMVIPFAFGGIKLMHKQGFEYPPSDLYRLTADGEFWYEDDEDEKQRLDRLAEIYSDKLPDNYTGRHIAPSDVLELYDGVTQKFYYRDEKGFAQIDFYPCESCKD